MDLILKGIAIFGAVVVIFTLLAIVISSMANRIATTNRGRRSRH